MDEKEAKEILEYFSEDLFCSNKEDNSRNYIRHAVDRDGDCGYTAFGIVREEAFKLLSAHINQISKIVILAVKHALLTEKFFEYLKKTGSINENLSVEKLKKI